MNMNLAAQKAPPLAPGEFRFVTKALSIEPSEEPGKRRFKTIASSTIRDGVADEIKMSALEDMARSFQRGLNIFIDHKHSAENVFGRSDMAEIKQAGENDPVTGQPVWDLHIGGVVNEPNPRAVQLADSIDGGYVTFGTSVGAIVKQHKRNGDGGMDIYHVDCKEASIVGIPMNQRSWTYKAAKAAQGLVDDDSTTELDDEDETLTESAPPPETPDTSEAQIATDEAKAESPETNKSADADADTAVNAGVQESDAETPETTPVADSDQTDTPDVEKAAGSVTDEVKELLGHVTRLVTEIGGLRTENDALKVKLASYEAQSSDLTEEIGLARDVIAKVMETPLRSQTAGFVKSFTDSHDLFSPEISAYLQKRKETTR